MSISHPEPLRFDPLLKAATPKIQPRFMTEEAPDDLTAIDLEDLTWRNSLANAYGDGRKDGIAEGRILGAIGVHSSKSKVVKTKKPWIDSNTIRWIMVNLATKVPALIEVGNFLFNDGQFVGYATAFSVLSSYAADWKVKQGREKVGDLTK